MIREPGPLDRELVIDGKTWQWECGSSHVKMRSPRGETKIVPIHSVLGIGRCDWLNKIDDGYRPEVTPSHIEDYARKCF